MADKVTKALNVEVELHSKEEYGVGLEQGVKFVGIDGYWKISHLADIYNNDAIAGRWPPQIGHVFFAKLQAKPATKKGCYYRDIWEISKATGAGQTWGWQAELGGATAALPANVAKYGDAMPPPVPANSRERSIERQVVVKAMAEVIAAWSGTMKAAGLDDTDYFKVFTARCDELWGGHAENVLSDTELKQDGEGSEPGPPPDPQGELQDEDLPF